MFFVRGASGRGTHVTLSPPACPPAAPSANPAAAARNRRHCRRLSPPPAPRQRCGHAHPLSEFDPGKHSCRKQLERHNARR